MNARNRNRAGPCRPGNCTGATRPGSVVRIISSLCSLCLCVHLFCRSAQAQDLRIFESAHYRIHTDLDKDLSDDLAKRMDAMYDEYTRRLAGFSQPPNAAPLEAYIVHTQEKYLHLAGLTLAGTGGSFNA